MRKKVLIISRLIVLAVSLLIQSSCLKEELPVPPYDRGDAITSDVNMGPDYRYQIWYSLEKDTTVSINLKTAWDVRFSCSSSLIQLNSSRAMMAYKTNETTWNMITDTSGFSINKTIDYPSGHKDSSAIGDWSQHSNIYIIDMGYDWEGTHLGFYKMRLINEENDAFTFEYGPLGSNQPETYTINKKSSHHFVYFSFIDQTEKSIEPSKNEYNLVFTQYTHLFYEPFSPYLVTGVLTNPSHRVGEIKSADFDVVEIQDQPSRIFLSSKYHRIRLERVFI